MRTLFKIFAGLACLAMAYAVLIYQVKHHPFQMMWVMHGDHMRQTVDPKSFFTPAIGIFFAGSVAGATMLGMQFDQLVSRYLRK